MKNKEYRNALEILNNLTLFDDTFFNKVFDNSPECLEVMLQIILNDKGIKVIECVTQKDEKNILFRSIRFDIIAKDTKGRIFNVEIQKEDKGTISKRARFHSSVLDNSLLKKGESFNLLPDSYVIFISENDVLKKGIGVYKIQRYIESNENLEKFNDGSYIVYVNGSYKANDEVGRLIHDLRCKNAKEIYIKELRDKVKFYKEEDEGVNVMSSALQKYINENKDEWYRDGLTEGRAEGKAEGKNEAKKEIALRLISLGTVSIEEIAECADLDIDEIKKLKDRGIN